MNFDASVWGTVGEWVASAVALAALVVAVVTASRAHSAQQRAERRYEDRVLSEQARRIRWTLSAGGSSVAAMIAASSITFGRPERSSSARPDTPSARKRSRHLITVG